MQLILNVISANVVVGYGCDKIYLHLDRRSGIHPYTEEAVFTLECAAGTYAEYLNKTFPEITEVRVMGRTQEARVEKLARGEHTV